MKHLFVSLFILTIATQAHATVYKRDTQKWQQAHERDEEETDEPGLIMCADHTYVRGTKCVMCPDHTYQAHECKRGPDGRYY